MSPFCLQLLIPSRHEDERRKADKLKKKKKRRKERQLSAGEGLAVQGLQHPVSFSGQPIKEEPEDEISIALHPQRLLSPVPCKEEPSEEQHWDGQDLQEGVVRVQKVEGFSGNRTVFRQGKQVVFRDEDGSGEDEDIMVDSGTLKATLPGS